MRSRAHEGHVVEGGAFCAETGIHTGRSPKDKFVVCDDATEKTIWWEKNGKLSPQQFDVLLNDFLEHAKGKQLFAQDLYGGADPKYRIKARVFTELAWHSLFIRSLLIRPERTELAGYVPDFTILCLPTFKADPKKHGVRSETVIALNLTKRMILIGGSFYAGEMKKSVFTTLNYYLPAESVMPMHCSANVGKDGDVALFFGLSGTGKTTLSADPNRTLIGDDEHGWGPQRRVQLRGRLLRQDASSCRARPSPRSTTRRCASARCWKTSCSIRRRASCDFDDESKTENTRSAYPLEFIPNASRTGRAGMPKNLVMLTADAYGVMPPIAKLTPAQAMYHFLSGYTAKVAGTEKGLVGVAAGILHLLRRAVPAAPSDGLRQPAARTDRRARRRLLAGQHRLDRGHLRRRPPHADQGDAHAADRGARRLAEQRQIPHRSVFRLLGADLGAGHRAAPALSVQDLAEQSRVRRDRAQARRDVPEELRAVRDPRRRRRARRAPEVRIAGIGARLPPAPKWASSSSLRLWVPLSRGRAAAVCPPQRLGDVMASAAAAHAANYLAVRQDWLDRRKEPILEPELPIIDPHHHLWDRAGWRYLLDELLADTNSGHNILATVFVQARAMHRADGPEEMKPVGETEFVNGVAAMTASGIYGKIRACAGIVGHADLTLGSRVEPVLEAHDARRRRALPRHPPHHGVGRRPAGAQSGQSGAARHARPTRNSAKASRCWRGWAIRSMPGSIIRRSTS